MQELFERAAGSGSDVTVNRPGVKTRHVQRVLHRCGDPALIFELHVRTGRTHRRRVAQRRPDRFTGLPTRHPVDEPFIQFRMTQRVLSRLDQFPHLINLRSALTRFYDEADREGAVPIRTDLI